MSTRVRFAGIALFAIATMAACRPSSDPSGDVAAGPAAGEAERIVITDGGYEPDDLELTAGTTVTVEVRNEDDRAHDFAIEALDINTGTIEPNEAANVKFTVPDTATEFVCTYHSDMKGRIEAG